MKSSLNGFNLMLNDGYSIDIGYDGMGVMDGYMGDEGNQGSGTSISMDGLLSNWFFVGGVSGGVFLLSVAIGLLLAKLKIKKGFDVYED